MKIIREQLSLSQTDMSKLTGLIKPRQIFMKICALLNAKELRILAGIEVLMTQAAETQRREKINLNE